jgi:transcriptional regulator with XRE-family HTH domain
LQKFNGHYLRAARKSAGLKKEQFGLLVDGGYEAINLYECGHRRPPTEVLERLAAVLEVNVCDFFDDEAVSV